MFSRHKYKILISVSGIVNQVYPRLNVRFNNGPHYSRILLALTITAGLFVLLMGSLINAPVASAAAGDQIQGVVVASAGTLTANTMNAIIATGGYVSVKSPMGTAGTVNQYVIASVTPGKTGTSGTANGTKYGNAGLALTSTSTTCTANNDNCRGSVLLNFMPD